MALKIRRGSCNINHDHHIDDDGFTTTEKDIDMTSTTYSLPQQNGVQGGITHLENAHPPAQQPQHVYGAHAISSELERPELMAAFPPKSQVLMDMDDMDELALDTPSYPGAMALAPALPVLPPTTKRRVKVTPVSPTSVARTRARARLPSSPDVLCVSSPPPLPLLRPELEQAQEETVEQRRNPKRKASSTVCTSEYGGDSPVEEPDNLLEEALMSMTDDEIAQWEGWIELESEPAFLDGIIRKWGVEDVKIEEVMCIDNDILRTLPNPIYGLVFLFEYRGDDSGMKGEEIEDGNVWFANQTTDNACASVALLNILMNTDIDLGDTLRQFKQETEGLSTPLRGWKLSTNTSIRSAHNYLVRKMDCMNADLYLDNIASEAATAPPRTKRRNVRRKTKKKTKSNDAAYHFIAYVPSGGLVWELDGLKSRPVCLGPVPSLDDDNHVSDEWVSVATPRLMERIEEYDGSTCFNLLALCKSPMVTLPATVARAIKSLRVLDERMRSSGDPDWSNLIPLDAFKDGVPISFHGPEALASLGGITAADIDAAEVLDNRLKCDPGGAAGGAAMSITDARALHEQLVTTLEGARGEYFVRESVAQDNAARVEGRKQNWMPAIHAWLKALAEKGVLQDLIAESKE